MIFQYTSHMSTVGWPGLIIMVLDEIDVLVTRYGDQLLYSFTRAGYEGADIPYMIIGISNDLRFKDLMDPRVLYRVVEEHVREAYERIDVERTAEVIKTLPFHSKIILASLVKAGPSNIQSSKLYAVYTSMCRVIGEEPLSYRRFYSLVSELAVMGLVSRRIYNYGRRGGRVSTVRLMVDRDELLKSLMEDPLIEDIL